MDLDKSIYKPEEDSYLLAEAVNKILENQDTSKLKILEIGIGSGFQLKNLEKLGMKKENIFGVDVNKKAVENCKNLDFKNCFYSDLFEKIKDKFDLIIFNPPYLPKDVKNLEPEESQLATTGGKKGSKVINKFLSQSKKHVKQRGTILLLTSSLTKEIQWPKEFNKRIILKKKLFFEELYVWEVKLKS